MPPKVYMTENEKLRAIGMLEAGQSQNSIARHFGKSKSVISRLVSRYRQTGGVKIRDGRGRPKKTTPRQDRYLRIIALRNRFISAPELRDTFRGATGIRLCKSTVHNRLREVGLKARRPLKGMQLTRAHKRLRNQWAQRHIGRQQRHWRYTMFSDESRFCLNFSDGRKRVWRRVGERYHPATVQQHDRYGGGSIMVWAGITYDQRTELMIVQGNLTGQRYVDQILRPVVVPFAQRIGGNFEFQDDNARPHRARVAVDFLRQQGVRALPWPAKSPDMSPIEHIWDVLGRRVRNRPQRCNNLQQLGRALQEEWRRIPREIIRRIIASMPRRCRACINARGAWTRY